MGFLVHGEAGWDAQKKSRGAGWLECLIFDRDLVRHRTAVKLSFARAKAETTGNCRPASGDARVRRLPKSSLLRGYNAAESDLAAETLFLSRRLSFRGYFWLARGSDFTGATQDGFRVAGHAACPKNVVIEAR
jgi:hypothetical protein